MSAPTFESVAAELKAALGDKPSPEAVNKQIAELPQEKKHLLVANADKLFTLENKDVQKAFTDSLITFLTSDAGLNHLEETAKVTARAIKNTQDMFNALEEKLRIIDSKYNLEDKKKFAPVMLQHKNAFNDAIKTSKKDAIDIAVYGERFAEVILPVVKDDTLSVDDKKSRVASFINESKEFEKESEDIAQKFVHLETEFSKFIDTFEQFGQDQEVTINDRLKALDAEIESLRKQIDSTRNATLTGMGVAAGVATVAFMFIGLFFPPAIPALITGACYAGGAFVVTGSISGAILQSWESDLSAKLKEKDDLTKSLTDIEQARSGLVNLGRIDLAIYKTSVGGISSIWKSASLSAEELLKWLKAAETDVDWIKKTPSSSATDFDKAVKIYSTMAKYLRDYAHGVETTCIM